MPTQKLVVYLMRGLPSCGKSYAARQLVGDAGVICETDEYFYTQIGDDPTRYDYDADRLEDARRWNFQRFAQAILERRSPIVVDRGNGRNVESREFVTFARDNGYQVELKEPDSPWWQELRVLLKYRRYLQPEVLDRWAELLAEKSRETHRVPQATIKDWMDKWRADLTVEDILSVDP